METSAAPAPACRICQGEEEPIIRPCRCEGTMAYAHPYCLAEWIAAHGRLNCEVCGTPYSFQIAVQDPPSLRSIRGAARLLKLFVKKQVRGLRATLGVAAEVVGVLLLLTVSAAAIWYTCWRCITRRSQRVSTRHVPFFVLWVAGFVLNAIPLAVLLLYERFHVWVFIHEDDVADLPPMPPQPQPTETPVDEAVAAARNAAFTTAKPHSEPRADHTNGGGGGVYVSVAHSAAASGSILELLRGKVKAAQKLGEKKRFWENTTLMYVAKFILVHLALAGAIVLGDVALQCLALCPPLLLATSRRLAADSNSVALVLFREVLATATFSSLTYWGAAFLLGLAMLLVVLRLAATHLPANHARLSRAVLLHCFFARGALAVVVLVLVWVTVVPVVTYVCLFPFFVEGDATVLMPPQEAWQVLRSERLLPFRCHSAAATAPSTRRLSQPLNVARALLLAAPDVWRGRSPVLFDPVTCGLDAYRLPPPQHLSQAAHFLSYCGCVLLRVCALPTWLALVGTLRATLLWLVTGAFAVLLPYTTLGGFWDGQPEFFAIFLHLPGRVFWRVLCEVPAMVALYAAAVGFPVFATLFHFFPQCFPRSLSYLSFFTFSNRFSEFDFVYTWYRIIRSAHTAVLSVLQRLFLSGDAGASAADAEEGLARHGAHVIERLAYGVCLLLANIFIGAVLEWTSWTAWFPLLGLFLNVGTVSWLGLVLGGGLHFARRTLDELRTRATMLCFYGTWITYGVNDVCIITKLSPPRINTLSASLMGVAVERQDMGLIMLVGYLHDEENTEPTMCFTAVLQRLTSYTLSRLATYPRMLVAALLTALAPLVLCSALQLDFVTPLSTDYVALPLWFSVLLRWMIGAAAGTVWVVVEGRVMRTALFQRCLRHAPEIILGSLSLEAVHAVAIPVVIHCAVVRLCMELLRRFGWAALNTAASTPREAMAAGMTGVYGVWWLGKYVARRWRPRALDRGTADNAQAVPLAAPQPPTPLVTAENAEAPQHQPATGEARPHPAPEAPAVHPAAEAAEGERVAGDGPPVRVAAEAPPANELQQAPAPPPPVQEQPPPQQQQQRAPRRRWAYFTGLRERISQWAASECATDVVLVSYTRDPSAPETA